METAAAKKMLHQRGQIILKVKRLSEFVTKFDLEKQDAFDLNSRFEKMDSYYEDYDECQLRIENHVLNLATNEQLLVDCENNRTEFEDQFFNLKSSIQSIIATITKKDNPDPVEVTHHSQLKLPIISLPNFNGDFENWLNFYEVFNSLIHDNPTLSPIQKFFYLRSALKDEASRSIQSMEITTGNYDIAWNLIKERFENKKMIVKKHVSAIIELPHVLKESSSLLRELSDKMQSHLTTLQKLGQPTEHWDTIIVLLLANKFDSSTRREWESSVIAGELPTADEIFLFVKKRCEILEALETHRAQGSKKSSNTVRTTALSSSEVQVVKCYMCQQNHQIYHCPSFINLQAVDRSQKVRELKLCFNCLQSTHQTGNCKSKWRCKTCKAAHNSLLHCEYSPHSNIEASEATVSNISTKGQVSHNFLNINRKNVFLSTAVVHVKKSSGEKVPCRVLLDSGSESNFITENMCQLLGLKKTKINMEISGVTGLTANVKYETNATISSRFTNFEENLDFLVLSKITGNLPLSTFDVSDWEIPSTTDLADPEFFTPNKIDMLLGGEIFYDLLCYGKIQLSKDLPSLRKTLLGWIVVGKKVYKQPESSTSMSSSVVCNLNSNQNSISKDTNPIDVKFNQPLGNYHWNSMKISLPTYLHHSVIKKRKSAGEDLLKFVPVHEVI